jgi:hypothetical protein
MHISIYIIIVFLIITYIYSYYRYPSYTEILQVDYKYFNFDSIYQKQPIVIENKSIPIEDIIKDNFNLNIVSKPFTIIDTSHDIWHKNKFKYLLIQCLQDGEILLYPAIKKMTSTGIPDPEESLIAIKLSTGQLLIIPFHWHYLIKTEVVYYGIHDYISYILP